MLGRHVDTISILVVQVPRASVSSQVFRSVCCLVRKPMWMPISNPVAHAPYVEVLLFSALCDHPIFQFSCATRSSFSLFFRKIPYILLNFLWELSWPSGIVSVYSPLPSPSKLKHLQYIPKKPLCLSITIQCHLMPTHDITHWTVQTKCD